jgi:hypothetical protein
MSDVRKCGINQEALYPFADPRYRPPTPEDVRAVLRVLGWTGREAAKRLGLGKKGDRTVRRWTGGERKIPYAAWRFMLLAAHLVNIEDDRQAVMEH